ncbi:MAG: hypothetical protein KKC03_13475 [Bacteroidetes bacterium]|nr:hypothetical protein [Bacteroidota bacterium]
MQSLKHIVDEHQAERYIANLESALLAQALHSVGHLPDERAKALLADFLIGSFNASSLGLATLGSGRGELEWQRDGTGFRLVWSSPTGLSCPLARLYEQADASWAALIVAGVRPSAEEAMLAAEWGVSRLAV